MNRSSTGALANASRAAIGGRGALVALITLVAALVALTIGAGGASAAGSSFGSKLNDTVQPSNAASPHQCESDPGSKCTWVMGEAYGNPGGEQAPKSGYLRKLKLVAGAPGSFQLQIVKTTIDGHTQVKRSGPTLSYVGQSQANYDNDSYNVEKFKTKVKIKTGERLAIKTAETSTLRCSSGGDNTLQHSPPLKKRDGKRIYDETDGCWMLIEGKVR